MGIKPGPPRFESIPASKRKNERSRDWIGIFRLPANAPSNSTSLADLVEAAAHRVPPRHIEESLDELDELDGRDAEKPRPSVAQSTKAPPGQARSQGAGSNAPARKSRFTRAARKVKLISQIWRSHGALVSWAEVPDGLPSGDAGGAKRGTLALDSRVIGRAGRYRALYFLGGCPTPVASTPEFIATYPKATLSVQPAPCGQPLQVDYLIDQHTAHAAGDWIGIVPVYGEGDSDNLDWTQAVKWARLGDANKGVVEIKSGPMYPGRYRAHLFLSEYRNRVAGSSPPFECAIDFDAAGASERFTNREVRLYVSSQWDMVAERRQLSEIAVPALKRFCDDRRVALSVVDIRSETSYAETRTPAGVRTVLEAVSSCRPFFVSAMGDRSEPPVPSSVLRSGVPCNRMRSSRASLSWLSDALALMPDDSVSLLEIETMSAFLVPHLQSRELSKFAFFYTRHPKLGSITHPSFGITVGDLIPEGDDDAIAEIEAAAARAGRARRAVRC